MECNSYYQIVAGLDKIYPVGTKVLFKKLDQTNNKLWFLGVVDTILTSTRDDIVLMVCECDLNGKKLNDHYYYFTEKEISKIRTVNEAITETLKQKTTSPYTMTDCEINNAEYAWLISNSYEATTLTKEDKDISNVVDTLEKVVDILKDIESNLFCIKQYLTNPYRDIITTTPNPIEPWYKYDYKWDKVTCNKPDNNVYTLSTNHTTDDDEITHTYFKDWETTINEKLNEITNKIDKKKKDDE